MMLAKHLARVSTLWRPFKKYRVRQSHVDRATIENNCRIASNSMKEYGLRGSFSLYETLIAFLRADRRYQVVPLKNFQTGRCNSDAIRIGLRHDVDDDLLTGLRAARHLARYGVPGTFYLLHTSHYYGQVEDGVFLRHPGLADLIRDLVVTGVEIGLHADPLGLYCRFGIDGAQGVVSEIDWLRSIGVRVFGTSTHNSAPVFGAENFEVFSGRAFADRREFFCDDKRIPLQTINEAEIGLSYEANFPLPRSDLQDPRLPAFLAPPPADAIRSVAWLRSYMLENPMFDRDYDVSIWPVGADAWFFAARNGSNRIEYPLSLQQVLGRLDGLAGGTRVIFNIHPEYVSG